MKDASNMNFYSKFSSPHRRIRVSGPPRDGSGSASDVYVHIRSYKEDEPEHIRVLESLVSVPVGEDDIQWVKVDGKDVWNVDDRLEATIQAISTKVTGKAAGNMNWKEKL